MQEEESRFKEWYQNGGYDWGRPISTITGKPEMTGRERLRTVSEGPLGDLWRYLTTPNEQPENLSELITPKEYYQEPSIFAPPKDYPKGEIPTLRKFGSTILGKNILQDAKQLAPRAFQEIYPEVTVHMDWDRANSPRFVLEAAGDILREFQKKYSNPEYIVEKLDRVGRLIKAETSGAIHPDDSLSAIRRFAPEKGKRLLEEYRLQPTKSVPEATAKDGIVALLEGDLKRAQMAYGRIKRWAASEEMLEEAKMLRETGAFD